MSIGVDGYLLLQESSDDNTNDTAGVKHDIGKYYNSVEKAVLFDYRYYFGFQRLRQEGIVFYTLAYVRLGSISWHWDPLYPTTYVTQKETHHSAGISLGSTMRFAEDTRWSLDINAGVFEKEKTIVSVDVANHSLTQKPAGLGPRVSVNVCYWFKRGKTAESSGRANMWN